MSPAVEAEVPNTGPPANSLKEIIFKEHIKEFFSCSQLLKYDSLENLYNF